VQARSQWTSPLEEKRSEPSVPLPRGAGHCRLTPFLFDASWTNFHPLPPDRWSPRPPDLYHLGGPDPLPWFGRRLPTIPHWKGPIVPCPSKIMLSDTTSALSISKGRAPVRGLRSKTCPLIVVAKLAVPITPLRLLSADLPFRLPRFPSVSLARFRANGVETRSFIQGGIFYYDADLDPRRRETDAGDGFR